VSAPYPVFLRILEVFDLLFYCLRYSFV